MINDKKIYNYMKAIKIGFTFLGINGFYQMHKDICDKKEMPWMGNLECLNDLNYNEFESLCEDYFNK